MQTTATASLEISMSNARKTRGRPRAFDTEEILDASMGVFWKQGYAGTTTRILEQSLGISQSSLYNAFGSKEKLFDQVVTRYEQQLDATVLVHLDRPDPDRAAIIDFLHALVAWIHHDDHSGCLVLNLSAEGGDDIGRMQVYRDRLRQLLGAPVRSFTEDAAEAEARTELLIAAILGLNISAQGGTDRAELNRLCDGIRHQVEAW